MRVRKMNQGYVQGTVTVGTNVIIVNPDSTTVVSTITGMERFANGSPQQVVTAKDEHMAFKLSLIPDKLKVQKGAIIRQSGKKNKKKYTK